MDNLSDNLLAIAEMTFGRKAVVRSIDLLDVQDSDGDPGIEVTVVFNSALDIQDGQRLLQFKLLARDALEDSGRTDFPIFRFVLAAEHDRHAAA